MKILPNRAIQHCPASRKPPWACGDPWAHESPFVEPQRHLAIPWSSTSQEPPGSLNMPCKGRLAPVPSRRLACLHPSPPERPRSHELKVHLFCETYTNPLRHSFLSSLISLVLISHWTRSVQMSLPSPIKSSLTMIIVTVVCGNDNANNK